MSPLAASTVDCASTQRISPSGRSDAHAEGRAASRRGRARRASSRSVASRSSGCSSSAYGRASQLRLGHPEQLEPRPVGADEPPVGRAHEQRVAHELEEPLLAIDVLVGAHPRRPVEGSPDAPAPLHRPRRPAYCSRRTASGVRQADQIPRWDRTAGYCCALPRRSFGLDHRIPGQSPGVSPVSVHFVNNVLAAAASYIEEDPDTARDVLAELGAFLSHRLRGPRAVSPAEELDHVGVYLRLEQARFPGRIEVELPTVSDLPSTLRRRGRDPGAAGRGASAAGWREHTGHGARGAARPRRRAGPAARSPRRARRGRRAPADPVGRRPAGRVA